MRTNTKKVLVTSTAPAPVPAFTVTVGAGEAIGPYKEGETLLSPTSQADFFRQWVGHDDEVAAKRIAAVHSDQIVAVIKAVKLDEGSNVAINQARLDAIEEAKFSLADASEIPPTLIAMKGSNAALALELGAELPEPARKALTFAIESQKDANAGPIVLEAALVNAYKNKKDKNGNPVLSQVPLMGYKFRGDGAKGNKAPYGYRRPDEKNLPDTDSRSKWPIYNGPWDYYKTEVKLPDGTRTERNGHWALEFVAEFATFPAGSKYFPADASIFDTVQQIRALMNGATKPGTPKTLTDLEGQPAKLNGLLADAAFELNRRVAVTSKAFSIYQRKQAIAERFKDTIRVGLYGERMGDTAEAAVRRTKPFVLYQRTKDANGDWNSEPSNPITIGQLLAIEPRKFATTAKVADLLAKKPRGTNKGAEGNKAQPGALYPEINSTDKLGEALSSIANFVDDGVRYNAILQRIGTKEGGALASAIVKVYSDLTSLATNADVVRIATAHDASVVKALADEATAEKAAA